MRIAFVVIGNSRRSNYLNGFNLRYGNGGGSGTDTSTILVAEYLAKQGHDVVFVTDRLEPHLEKQYKEKGINFIPGSEVNGVKYTYSDFSGINNLEFDVLISMLWFDDYNNLPIKVTKSLIYWSHMQWIYGVDKIQEYVSSNNLNFGIVHISNWEKQMNKNVIDGMLRINGDIKTILIPNPVMDDIITEVNQEPIIRNPHKFIFHASWARGGEVALNSVRSLYFKDKEFHAFDYLMTISDNKDVFFHNHGGTDKKTLFKHIAESEYFIYPLYTPYEDVHKDTFSCVVAEAIALGCIVVTYPLGALPEIFNGYCSWIELPDGVNYNKIQSEPLTKDPNGDFKNISKIADKIYYLDNNPEIKESIRNNGKKFIIENFNINRVGLMWVDFINKLTN